ncbi:MAG: ergothioneine biosynthesis protein EgtB [Beijerinckiaceae bacterium]
MDLALNSGLAASSLGERYQAVRGLSEALARGLTFEDQCIQSMPDASPTKWHLAHTSWFFERIILQAFAEAYAPFDKRFDYLFNSYYEGLGPQYPRPQRGLLSRPSGNDVLAYRHYVDQAILRLLEHGEPEVASLVTLGLHHEEQHQELILTDIKHAFFVNPLRPAYAPPERHGVQDATAQSFIEFPAGEVTIGAQGTAFSFDNERPAHAVLLRPYRLAARPVTCGEYLAFIEDGGYRRAEFWLSDGWRLVQEEDWQAPLYWQKAGSDWQIFTLRGERPLDPGEPVAHVSCFEAAAFAAWSGKRLPTEFEWEAAVASQEVMGNFLEQRHYHPRPGGGGSSLAQAYGDVWEWTRSSYDPYPGYKPFDGPLAEYNGKFMIGQMVLRGGSCATPQSHIRATYRNFFPPSARWQFSGFRLAEDQ